jgi:GGDEF domain-containing protein
MISNATGEGLTNPLLQTWLILLVLVGGVSFVLGLLWSRRKVKFAVNKGIYGSWHTSIPRYRRALHRLTAELERARRYGNSLTIAVLSVDADQPRQRKRSFITLADNAEIASHFFFSIISALLRDNLRNCDMLTYDVTNDYYVILMPETSASFADQAMTRLNEIIAKRVKVNLRCGIAEFPTDGLTIDDLVNHAYARSHRTASETPSPKDAARPSQETQRREFLAK